MMKIVLDAMGTDTCPVPDVEGAVLAAREHNIHVCIVGDETQIRQELSKYDVTRLKLDIVHAEQAVTMTDKPSVIGRSKPNSSMHVGMQLVKDGTADAFVTMGNTGAAQAIAMLFVLKRISGVKRPALSVIFRVQERPIIFLDIGANTDTRAEWLAQFAVMGSIYASKALGLTNPRLGIVSNGEEEGKGTQLTKDASDLIRSLNMNFVGNVEPKEIFANKVDVVISDGFTGNVLIKTYEATSRYIAGLIREELKRDLIGSIGGLLIKPGMQRMRRRIDTFEIGGAPLLGVQGVVIIGHGSSNAIAVKNAILQARVAAEGGIISAIAERIGDIHFPTGDPVS